ncbi:hypothetical protein JG687_00000660 [Phytophthora cactorum]|uniref:Zinc finger PHD-type domain-containing protein n=1 Tax=Phytophthora cactorum TaxID=29920 RepID=A0A329SW33_9STRA|nr:hypothetical protein Pcac1_g2396 [Phytophthora cactorum]KAG2843286.1 hypothetical protein PC112_g2683 [Phytophthora cactorum]KAG2845638.1 hypothetical protein PC111_g1484 [Phytophthora cactorum]KAG2866696.1 hypothetical protein PC113_g2597 [Phytophthora cactorum]KAG2935473.1 hypothetical protein PC114_g530 [Phytophthora cactorum]
MADASDIYRRFVEAPLRLKTRTPSPSPPSTPPPSTQQYDASNPSPWGDSPAFSTRSKEVRKLRRRVEKIKLFATDAAIPRDLDDALKAAAASDTESSAGASSADAAASKLRQNKTGTGGKGPKTLLKKKKRVTRSVSMKNEDTGADFMDTPTKASKPPKRFRKHSRDLSKREGGKENCNVPSFSLDGADVEDKKNIDATQAKTGSSTPKRKTSVTIALPVRRSRRLQHVKAESPILTVAAQAKETSDMTEPAATSPTEEAVEDKKKVSDETTSLDAVTKPTGDSTAQTTSDLIATYCDALLLTNTISGCFFALSWNALRGEHKLFMSKSASSESNPLESVFAICHGIAECEKLAQHSFPSKSPTTKSPKTKSPKTKSPKTKSPKSGVPRRRSSGKMLKPKKTKKSVHFRSFDLSCLNLQYVEDEQVAVMVDKILTHYGSIMEQLEKIVSRFDPGTDSPVQAVLRELSCVMASPSNLYSSNATTNASKKKTYRRAFGGRDPYSQHEIRICGEYFARQFGNLLLPRASSSSPPQFLQGVFSSLASSSVRFKLRVLFIESEDFGEEISGGELGSRVLLDEDGKPFPAMAPYEHQDLGAAIHWALQESVLYWSLVQPLYNMLGREEGSNKGLEEDSPVTTFLDESAAEDLDHMEKYVLARRFLRFHLTKSWRQRLKDSDVAETWASIEKVCSLAKRFHFEDEAHLFPLAPIDAFIGVLAREEPTLQRMEAVLQSFYEQKYGTSSLQPEPCMECHHLITREENSSSIRCTSCARRFHLGCLHLPESFTQYAEHYTCPACFLGRGGY